MTNAAPANDVISQAQSLFSQLVSDLQGLLQQAQTDNAGLADRNAALEAENSQLKQALSAICQHGAGIKVSMPGGQSFSLVPLESQPATPVEPAPEPQPTSPAPEPEAQPTEALPVVPPAQDSLSPLEQPSQASGGSEWLTAGPPSPVADSLVLFRG